MRREGLLKTKKVSTKGAAKKAPLSSERWLLQKRERKKLLLTAVSSEAILAPLGSVVSCVTGAGAPDDEAGVGSTRPGRGSVMGTPDENKRSEEAAAAAIGATTAEEDDADIDDDASAEAAARPARGSSPDSSEAALDDETMVPEFWGENKRKKTSSTFSRERSCD